MEPDVDAETPPESGSPALAVAKGVAGVMLGLVALGTVKALAEALAPSKGGPVFPPQLMPRPRSVTMPDAAAHIAEAQRRSGGVIPETPQGFDPYNEQQRREAEREQQYQTNRRREQAEMHQRIPGGATGARSQGL